MRQLLLVITLFAVALVTAKCNDIGHLYSEDKGDEPDLSCVTKDIHEYLDGILVKVRGEMPDPMRLPPRSSFVELSDGLLWGLSNITRLGEAEVRCEGTTIIVKATLSTDELKGRYTWTRERKHWEGYVVFISDDFQAEVEAIIEKHEGEQTHPRLERFEIKKFKKARIEITGLGFFTWALGEMTTLMSGIFQRAIASAVQGPLKEALERQMREINIE